MEINEIIKFWEVKLTDKWLMEINTKIMIEETVKALQKTMQYVSPEYPDQKLLGQLSTRVFNSINNAYKYGWIIKPLREVTDAELGELRNFGLQSIIEFRKLIPAPEFNIPSPRWPKYNENT